MKILEEVPEYVAQSGGTLHPYQLEGVNCLRHLYPLRRNYILGDQSGLGKSVQAINAIYSLYKEVSVRHYIAHFPDKNVATNT